MREVLSAVLVALGIAGPSWSQDFATLRSRMIDEIRRDVEWTRPSIGSDTLDPRVLQVMGEVPRHEFVPPAQVPLAYENRPLPIGYGQTISQPYIVALMTHLVEPSPGDVVLEVGTGSGYQAAVLSRLVREVYTVEILPELGESARERLQELGYTNVEVRVGDGYHGWPAHGPFEAILVTAASSHVPPPLVRQLRPGGRMVIPVGNPFQVQQLTVVEKSLDGEVRSRQLLPVRFVPLTGGH